MKLGITTKLFLAVLLSSLFVLIAMGAAGRWSFTRDFLGYLNDLAAQRMAFLVPRFERAYRTHGSWDFVRNNPQQWFGLMRPIPGEDAPADVAPDGVSPPESDLTGAVFRFSLLDAQERFVMGNARVAQEQGMVKQAIIVDGRTVGWLALAPFQSVSGAGAERFYYAQLRATWLIGVQAALIAVAISLWVARTSLRPIKGMADATHRLAAGDYTERVPVSSQDEVGSLAQDFNRLAAALESNERMRRNFIADVSHELRTPLAVLRGELEAMEDGVRPLSADSLKSLQAEVATLSKLVNDLYELSLADVGALVYRKTRLDLATVLQVAMGPFRERCAARGLNLELELELGQPLPVEADESRLQQLFSNLAQNSIRYTDAGGTLRVHAHTENGSVLVDFFDSAPGVPDDHLPRLFERFFRGEASRNRASGGAGLGLAICRSIVEAHDGQIEAKASPLGGVWIRVRFPLAH